MPNQTMPREVAVERLTRYVEEGRAKSATIVKKLMEETEQRVDVVVPRQMMNFHVLPERVELNVDDPRVRETLGFSEWSEAQMLGTLGIQQRFLNGLQGDGKTGATIATQLLNDLRYRIGGEEEINGKARRLLRVVKSQVRGWLSPTYGMFDQSEILGGFAQAIQNVARQGIVFTDGVISDRRYGITAVHPQILEPFPGEYILAAEQLQSSDYGFGAVDLVQQVIRLVCKNGMLGFSLFRKIHRSTGFGGDENAVFEISERTRQLKAQATVSLLTDGVRAGFSDQSVDKMLDQYRVAAAREINPKTESDGLRKEGLLTKEDADKAPALLAMDLEILPDTPSKNSALRFGQLLAWMGSQAEGEKQINLMEAAGRYALN